MHDTRTPLNVSRLALVLALAQALVCVPGMAQPAAGATPPKAAQAPPAAQSAPESKEKPGPGAHEARPAPARPVDPARLAIAPAGRVDVGSVGPREKKALVYTFTNTSKAPISFRVTDNSPGLVLKQPLPADPLGPGESRKVELELDPTGFVGWQPRNMRLVTDDPRQGEYRLPIAMTVREDLTVDAAKKSFAPCFAHESPQVVFTFTRETGDPTSLSLEKPLPPHLEHEFQHKGKQVELRLTLRPRALKPGVALGLEHLSIASNAPLQSRFDLYVDWKLRSAVQPSPTRLVFLDPQEKTLNLLLTGAEGKPFRILSATVQGAGFKVAAPPAGAQARCSLAITREADKTCKAELQLRFEGVEETLVVPLSYLPPEPPAVVE